MLSKIIQYKNSLYKWIVERVYEAQNCKFAYLEVVGDYYSCSFSGNLAD